MCFRYENNSQVETMLDEFTEAKWLSNSCLRLLEAESAMPHLNSPEASITPHGIAAPGSYLHDEEMLTRLIGRIYETAMQATLWPETLAKIASFVGGQAAGLLSKDSISNGSTPYYQFGVDPKQLQIYSETHSRFDPFSNLRFFDVEQIVSISELVPYDEFCRGRFFLDWMRPQGWVDAANCVLEKSASQCLFLSIIRSEEQGPVDDEMRERMSLIVPHVRRAVLMGRAVDLQQVKTSALANVLDGLRAGLFLISGDGRLMHANSAGHALLVAEDCLRLMGGRLAICDREINSVLQDALAAAAQAGVGIKNVALPVIAPNGDRYLVHLLPLSSGMRDAGGAPASAAAVFVRRAVLDDLVSEVIARAFDLTPAELRVLLAVVEVGGIPQAASALGVADSTVKTHIGRLFEKTGTCRQADLVKLAAGYCTPLLN